MKTGEKNKPRIELVTGYLNGELIFKIHFDFNKRIIEIIKTIDPREKMEPGKQALVFARTAF